jgi:FKBP-type peptidyl-prolyl cis-trans isomerase 2
LDDGSIFDTSEGRLPLSFEAGSGQVIPGFDNGVIGMKLGEEKNIVCKAADAYGDYREEMIQTVPRKMFEAAEKQLVAQGKKIEKGIVFGMRAPDGRIMHATVIDVNDDSLKLDLNHMLAGKDLHFKVKVEGIN